jgi:U2 small nuclear ribonucleoprotein A'
LGVAGPHDAIDFTDNDIQVLGHIPLSPRITTLLLARNRVATIHPTLVTAVPNLTNLVLASNNLTELADLDLLGQFPRLTHLVLADNPVAKKEHYRSWIVWRCPTVRFLDYVKVKEAERERSRELFGSQEEPSALAQEIMGTKSTAMDISARQKLAPSTIGSRIKLTEDEKKRLKERINKATNLNEILALEKELKEGRVPSGVQGDAMEE